MGDKGPDLQSRAGELVDDVVEYFKKPPSPEPELDTLLRYTKQDGNYYLVPKFAQNAQGQTVVESYYKMNHRQFNRFIYSKNVEILSRKAQPFKLAVERYKSEKKKLETKARSKFRRSETHDTDRAALERRIKEAWHNWEVEFRDARDSRQAKLAMEEIEQLQGRLAQMKPQGTDEIFSGSFDKFYFDVDELDRVSKQYARAGGDFSIKIKKEQFVGNIHDLIAFYDSAIDGIESDYLKDIQKRIDSNSYWLRKLSKRT